MENHRARATQREMHRWHVSESEGDIPRLDFVAWRCSGAAVYFSTRFATLPQCAHDKAHSYQWCRLQEGSSLTPQGFAQNVEDQLYTSAKHKPNP